MLQHVGGAIARVPVTDTPYFNRDALYDCFPISIWNEPEEDALRISWARELWDATPSVLDWWRMREQSR